jgi:hypothetical protein
MTFIEPFHIGRSYNRRGDIHARFGGQERGGISTPQKFLYLPKMSSAL